MRQAFRAIAKQPGLIIICLLSIALGFSIAANLYNHTTSPAIAAAPTGTADLRVVFEDIAAKLEPSVVNITSEKTVEVTAPNFGDFFDFGPFSFKKGNPEPRREEKKSTGTGFIVRSDGYIMTNDHVVRGADRVTVKLSDGREFTGKVFRDFRTDLAIVKIEANNLPAVEFANSDKIRVGQWTMAIGNPFGLRNTVTVGVVSAVRRETDPNNDSLPYPEVIQTDAAINFGNSGGPLVDVNGRVLGINGAIYSPSGGNVGIGFAIPANTAKFVMDQLISKGKVVRGYLGLLPSDLTPVLSEKLGIKEGALVQSVDKDSPADKAGVQVKDVITKVEDKKITNAVDLRNTVQAIAPGTDVKIVVVRDKKDKTLTVKLGEAPSVDDEGNTIGDNSGDKTGMAVQPLTSELAKQLGVDSGTQGVVVRSVKPGSPASRAGIKPKDVIIEIDNTPVTSVATFANAVNKLKSGETVIIVVQRGERSTIVEMSID